MASYLDVGGFKSITPYMAAFASALGQRLSPSGKLAAADIKNPINWVDIKLQGWKKDTPKSIIKQYGEVYFNPNDPEDFKFEKQESIPGQGSTEGTYWSPIVPPSGPIAPSMGGWEAQVDLPGPPQRHPMQLDAGSSGNSILDLMNTERAMQDGQHYPAILHKDEEVINPMASEVFRPILQQMNQAVPSNSQAVPPVMDVGGRIEEQRLLQQRGSPWPPMPAPPSPTDPQYQLGRGRAMPMINKGGPQPNKLTAWEQLLGQGRAAPTIRGTEPKKLDPKKKKVLEEAAEIISVEMMEAQKEQQGKTAPPGTPSGTPPGGRQPPGPPPRAFRPGWNMEGRPMNIDWEYIQSLPTGQAQAILQQYADSQEMPTRSLQQVRAGVDPSQQRQQLMQGLMGQYRGGAEMPGVKGEAVYSTAKGDSAQSIIDADVNYKNALTLSEKLRRAVVNAADPQEASKLRQLEIKNQQDLVKLAQIRAKQEGMHRDYQKEYVKLQVMMDPSITVDDIMRGLPEPAMKFFRDEDGNKVPKARQEKTLTREEVIDIITEFSEIKKEGDEGTDYDSQRKAMGG